MATAFVAMNDIYGPLFGINRAVAASVELAAERASDLSSQFIFDGHTHFLRDDTRIKGFVEMRRAVGKAGRNPKLGGKPPTIEDFNYRTWRKANFLDTD